MHPFLNFMKATEEKRNRRYEPYKQKIAVGPLLAK